MSEKRLHYNINGKWVRYDRVPCYKCDYRYHINCPMCQWNATAHYDTYSGEYMTDEEAKSRNEMQHTEG